jgi:hypothetical protein
MLAAQLWGGPSALLSHRAAALILGLDGITAARPELWLPVRKAAAGVIVHTGVVASSDVTTTGPFRHTGVTRTVIDLARVLDDDALELVLESALRTNPRRVRHLVGARRPTLRRVLARRGAGTPPTESEVETLYIQLLRTVGVPPPVRQHCVIDAGGRLLARLDLCWPEAKLWVELDSKAWHDRPEALFRDRSRQNAVVAELEWLPLRFTWADVVHDADATGRRTAAMYRRRVARLGPEANAG